MNRDLTDNYRGVFSDNRLGFGRAAALLVIDFMQGYTTEGSALFAPGVVSAVHESRALLAAARAAGIMIVHTQVRYQAGAPDGGMFVRKIPVLKTLVDGNPLAEFCNEVAPLPGELVICKQYASAFFATSLSSVLVTGGIDTVIIIGCSTSGCVRASAVDAISHGFHTIVVRECVGDRHPDPHAANLFDIDAKYGDVVDKQAVLAYFERSGAA